MNIRQLTPGNLDAVARVHIAAFPDSAISRLGREAARRYYESLMVGPHDAVFLGAFDDGRLLGFNMVGIWRNAERFFVRRNVVFLTLLVATRPWLLAQPFFRSRISLGLRLLARRLGAPNLVAPPGVEAGKSFGVLAIAVDPTLQGKGVGRELMLASETEGKARGFRMMDLSVHADNAQAIAFYERMGWEKFLSDGAWHGFMTKRIG